MIFGLFIAFLCMLGLVCLAKKKYGISFFNLLWALILAICFKELSSENFAKTLLCLSLMIFFVNFGFAIAKMKITTSNSKLGIRSKLVAVDTVFNDKLFFYIQIVGFVILFFYMIRTILLFGFDLSSIRVGNNSDSDVRILNSIFDTVLFYGIGTPIIYISSFVIAFNMSQKIRTKKKSISLFVLSVICYLGTVAGRTLVFRIILFFCAAIAWMLHDRKKVGKIKIGKYIFIGVAIFGALSLFSLARDSLSNSFINQVFLYIRGAVAHMNFRLEELVDHQANYFGYVTYGGVLYYPVKFVALITGWDIQTSAEIMEFLQQSNWIDVGGKLVYYNALLPNAFYYYYDMGYIGIILFSTLFGVYIRKSEFSYYKREFFSFVIWATCIYAIGYSVLGGIWWTSTYPMAVLYCWILRNKLYRSIGV